MDRKSIGLVTGIVLFLYFFLFTDLDPDRPMVSPTLAVAMLMASWWISEAIPLSVTALLPLVLFPLLGIVPGKEIATSYMNHIIFVYVGGFMVALAMEKWNLHKRIALKIMTWVGLGPGRILFGFMLATAFLSMWISNTASTMMMLPIILSIIGQLEYNIPENAAGKYATGVLLAIAYSASVGGITTLVGSPTNLVYPQQLQALFPEIEVISFTEWMVFAAPISLVMFGLVFGLIYLRFVPKQKFTGLEEDYFKNKYRSLGKASYEEKAVLVLFILLAMLWTFRTGIAFDRFVIPGWGVIFNYASYINDATAAIFIGILLFIIPSGKKDGTRLMDWQTAHRLPWDIVLLFGGGFALASGFQSSGLAVWMGEQLSWTGNAGPYVVLLAILTLMIFLTELTSNVASIQMLLPVFAALAISSNVDPVMLMFPATLASSMAFMLPTATPPNAIVFGSHRIEIRTMVRTGLSLNILAILVILLFTWLRY
ncbi:MAG: SLC13 family permease [Bacteroidales bacterium]|nr:SLC13 family permease [Bacteroidales bacterium]